RSGISCCPELLYSISPTSCPRSCVTDRNTDLRGTVSVLPGDTVHEEEPAFVSTPVLTLLARFFPGRTTLALEASHVDDAAAEITLDTISTHSQGSCPLCHVQITRVHSRYTRTVADVPWGAYPVLLQLRGREFFCGDHRGPPRL